jgi:acetolactate synthase-1/2/3 large subunit
MLRELRLQRHAPLGANADKPTDLCSPPLDWVQLSRSMGVPGVSVETAEDLANELERSLDEPGLHLIEMKLTR